MLGAAITLPMVLVSGPIAGFVLGRFLLVKYFGAPDWVVPVCVLLGFAGSGLQSYRLIQEINRADSKKDGRK